MSVLLFLLGVALAAHSSERQPVNSAQLMAWLTAGVPGSRLVRIVQERGLASVPGKEQIHQLETAGADATLVRTLTKANLKPAASPNSSLSQTTTFEIPAALIPAAPIPAALVQAASDSRAQRFHEAELALRQALISDPENASLHFALAAMLR